MPTCDISKYEWSISIFEYFMTKFHELPEQPSYKLRLSEEALIIMYSSKLTQLLQSSSALKTEFGRVTFLCSGLLIRKLC